MKIEKYRDISLMYTGDAVLTVACDSLGGVGSLGNDTVRTDGFTVGYHTAVVALAETLAAGAEPVLIVNSFSVALDSYGKSILGGISAAALEAGMDPKGRITGSSEENFKPMTTGIGVTVIGQLPGGWAPPVSDGGPYDAVMMGVPFVGDDVLSNKPLILSLEAIRAAVVSPDVTDLIPAGSKGVLYEANQLAESLGMFFMEETDDPAMIRKSAGPATCAVAAVEPGSAGRLAALSGKRVVKIGSFIKKR